MSVDNALQAALYTAIAATGYTVYDHVPTGTEYPYISIDTTVVTHNEMINKRAETHMVYLSFWSDYRGQKEIKTMMEAVHGALHQVRLTLTTGGIAGLWVASRDVRRDADGETFMGTMTVTAFITV